MTAIETTKDRKSGEIKWRSPQQRTSVVSWWSTLKGKLSTTCSCQDFVCLLAMVSRSWLVFCPLTFVAASTTTSSWRQNAHPHVWLLIFFTASFKYTFFPPSFPFTSGCVLIQRRQHLYIVLFSITFSLFPLSDLRKPKCSVSAAATNLVPTLLS